MIRVSHLQKSFGKKTAVRDLSFVAEDGVVTGLLGPNGAGKTTTLRMLSGLVRPDHGTVAFDGQNTRAHPESALANLGMLPERAGLYDRLTAREHIRYFGALHGLSGCDLERRVDECVAMVGLQPLADYRVAAFSNGERMKVVLARVLVHRAHNLLLDEPTNALDVMSVRVLRDIVRRLRDEGTCIIFSSHVMPEVGAMCDQLVLMASGRVVAQGSPGEIMSLARATSLEDAVVLLSEPAAVENRQ